MVNSKKIISDKSIKISRKVKKDLDRTKIHPRETYNDIIKRLLKEKWGDKEKWK